ncbi:protein-glutamine gamma-glutamyltransferase 4 [Tachyglossus aculeatus]|uniref:protein-glutamine gamma-glutamyltransferase 4 n=1 Tax=Tachyglossus aculeatus TaxID=9261 RepID=UPI0018F5FBF6|nr:protein-glutamine gamma-glutamyltransferase 4 [Tachyglossus aculeatus]
MTIERSFALLFYFYPSSFPLAQTSRTVCFFSSCSVSEEDSGAMWLKLWILVNLTMRVIFLGHKLQPQTTLRVLQVDFLKTQNARLHHTEDYNTPSLVVRRGQPFQLKLVLDRQLEDKDNVELQFCMGKTPRKSNETLVVMKLRGQKELHRWQMALLGVNGKECLLSVSSPVDTVVGKYLLSVKSGADPLYTPENNIIYFVFNPWCEGDAVFMAGDKERSEYVLNDTGYIYVGSEHKIHGRPWNYGQFEEDVLDSCMFLLDKSNLKPRDRKNPVIVSRAMSALVNANDDGGVLLANWSGMYKAGTSPLAWTGSTPILQQYFRTQKTVLYGQCWVFAGVLTTVMRSLGIPSRTVTNFASAHDTEQNLRVDIYLNEKGQKIEDLSTDSIWNFHVWTDVWMTRPDLPQGYEGWQVVDATPQEISQGVFQCGPAPLKAIRQGDVYLTYDTKFIFAEVNADKVFWLVKEVNGMSEMTKLREDTLVIGRSISTKAVGSNTREDITAQYKFSEGSPEERKAMVKACSYLSCEDGPEAAPAEEANIELKIQAGEAVWPGNPIGMSININNSSAKSWTIKLVATCALQLYTGKVVAVLGSISKTVATAGKTVIEVPVHVEASSYVGSLASVDDEVIVQGHVIAEIEETEEKFSDEVTLPFQYPPLRVEVPETVKIGQNFTCAFVFKNTLSIPLENCKLHAEGLGIFMLETFDQGDVLPGGIFKCRIICTPKKAGKKTIVAKLNSTQVKEIYTEKMITVTE